jgi:hypothetical protein
MNEIEKIQEAAFWEKKKIEEDLFWERKRHERLMAEDRDRNIRIAAGTSSQMPDWFAYILAASGIIGGLMYFKDYIRF